MRRTILFAALLLSACGSAWGLSGYTWEELQEIRRQKWEEKKLELEQEERQIEAQQESEAAILDRRHSYRVDESVISVREPKSLDDLKRMMVTPRDEVVGEPLPGVPLTWGNKTPGEPRPSYERWQLKKDDFIALSPVHENIRLHFLPDLRYFIIPYRVTNSGGNSIVLAPRLWILSDSGRVDSETGGFLAKRNVSASMLREVNSSQEFLATLHEVNGETDALAVLEPGATRWCAAIFGALDREMDSMKVIVEGLSNDYNFTRMLRPVLVLNYERKGDEFYPQFDLTNYKGKYWAQQWMWWSELSVGRPDNARIGGPTGQANRSVWVFDLTLKNSTGEDQAMDLEEVAMVFDLEIMDGVGVKVRIPDDGEGSIYKSEAIIQTAREFNPHRFVEGTLEKETRTTMTVAVDLEDINWEDVYQQVWYAVKPSAAAMYAATFIGAADSQANRALEEFMQGGLSEDLKENIREEVTAKLETALEEMMDKCLMRLEVSGKAGIATGTYELLRDFTRRTPLEERLRTTWPEVD